MTAATPSTPRKAPSPKTVPSATMSTMTEPEAGAADDVPSATMSTMTEPESGPAGVADEVDGVSSPEEMRPLTEEEATRSTLQTIATVASAIAMSLEKDLDMESFYFDRAISRSPVGEVEAMPASPTTLSPEASAEDDARVQIQNGPDDNGFEQSAMLEPSSEP